MSCFPPMRANGREDQDAGAGVEGPVSVGEIWHTVADACYDLPAPESLRVFPPGATGSDRPHLSLSLASLDDLAEWAKWLELERAETQVFPSEVDEYGGMRGGFTSIRGARGGWGWWLQAHHFDGARDAAEGGEA